jgi:hypothetical protein
MTRRFDLLAAVVCAGIFAVIPPSAASAGTIYLYTGQTYTSVDNDPLIDGEYDLTMRVTGQVELAVPLPASCVCLFSYDFGFDPGLLAFSFFDGVWSYDPDGVSASEAGVENAFFSFTTDASANIVSWSAGMFNSLGPGVPLGGADIDILLSSVTGDSGIHLCDNCDPSISQGFSTGGIGTWTVVSVPEPASLSLFLLGLVGTGLGRRVLRSRRVGANRTTSVRERIAFDQKSSVDRQGD